jgi:hypothetical protein
VSTRRRHRRYGALTGRERSRFAAAFVAVQAVAWLFVDTAGGRLAVAVLTAAVLLVLVSTRRSTPR